MLGLIAYRLADAIVRVFPESLVDRLACVLGRFAFAVHVPARATLEANLDRARSLDRDARATARITGTARRVFEHFSLALVDFLRLPRATREALNESIVVHGFEHWSAAQRAGRGVIVLSAHTGCWERGLAFLALRSPVHVITRAHPSPHVEAFFTRRRSRVGVRTIRADQHWIAAAAALRRGECVALMGDRAAASRGRSLCAWAAALSRRTGAAIVPAVMLRMPDGRHAAHFVAPLTAQACAGGGFRAAVRGFLVRHPDQWFAFEPLAESLT